MREFSDAWFEELKKGPKIDPLKVDFPGSINMEFNADSDLAILGMTKEHSYWWQGQPTGQVGPIVTVEVIEGHFEAYYTEV